MESLSSSVFFSNLSETLPVLNSPSSSSSFSSYSIKSLNKRVTSLKFAESPHYASLRVRSLTPDHVPGEAEEERPLNSGFGFVPDQNQALFLPQANLNQCESSKMETDKILANETPHMVSHGSGSGGGTRAGLFRTPISGGVQSATSAHDLPRPALAVRNLMEQARFAHLCTVMSRMHHRREGYPFGSLVDFVPDLMGHPIFSFSPLAIHTRNLLADPRCTLVVQIPGWSGLSNARVTIFGDVYPLPEHEQHFCSNLLGLYLVR
ncbi:hypothetical protein HS088_TW10G00618 [Tripterygium wilfordii]|uniref:CREG-like beta-barrel domain-containing protein n=1 Tax=Tripterygium wilfordii TaxID=458696 RepID=A0A7J7D5L7_TRIWF|nr:hypothetical protein HS088_TW10G00618 [Tripterygium wilfordii]